MFQVKLSEATAARRRIGVLLVDITDGFTPETGVTAPTINISKNGATPTSGAGTWAEIGNGQYYYEFTTGEVDTLGWIAVNIEKATVSRDYNAIVQIMAYDYAAATNLGLTAIPAVATGSAGAIPTTGSGANQIQVNGSGAISTVVSVSGSVGSVTGNVGGSVASVTGNIGGNLTGSVGSLTATAVQNIWDDLVVNNTVVGSIGVLISNNLNATVSSRATDAGVWTNATRTLTAGTNIVLAKGTGITGFNDVSATDVWAAATRTLSSGANIVLAKGTGLTGLNDISATDVWAAATRTLSSGTNIVLAKGTGITGFNDITSQSVWDVLAANVTTVNSIGVQLKTNVDTTISSRLASASYTAPPSTATITTAVWSEPIPGSYAAGTAGAKLNAASSAGDPWATALPGSYAAGTAGNILGNRLDAAITTRLASASYTAPPTTAAIATGVWSETLPGSYTATQAGFKLNAAGSAADPWSTVLPGLYPANTAGNIIGNRLDTNVGSRMATFTLPSNFSSLAITGTGAITVGTNNDKNNYSLALSQTFNTTGSVGSVTGSVASVTGNVGGNVVGSVNNVVGNVGGNVVGSVGSVTGSVGSVTNPATIWDHLTTNILTTNSIGLQLKTNVDTQISTRLASSSYTAAPTVTQIWQQAVPSTFTLGQAGYVLGTNLDATVSSRLASSSYSAAPTTTAIMQALWNQNRATASPTGGVPAVGTFGYFLDSRVSTAGGSSGGGVLIKQGPFKVSAVDVGTNNVLDLVKGDNRNIVLSVVDENNENIPLNAAYTHTVKIYDISGALVASYAGNLDYANGGLVSFNIDTTTTNVTGTYNTVLSINDGAVDTIYGGLLIEVKL